MALKRWRYSTKHGHNVTPILMLVMQGALGPYIMFPGGDSLGGVARKLVALDELTSFSRHSILAQVWWTGNMVSLKVDH